MVILIDNGHGKDTVGKCSPLVDGTGLEGEAIEGGRFREYRYNRIIAADVCDILKSYGYDARLIVPEEKDISLAERVKRINKVCSQYGAGNVVMVSVHCNAFGDAKEWNAARGWSVWTSKGQNNSDRLAEMFYNRAVKNFDESQKIRTDLSDGDADHESNFYIIKNAACPCCLTENFFMTNKEDVKFLLSEAGMHEITRVHVEALLDWVSYKTGKLQ